MTVTRRGGRRCRSRPALAMLVGLGLMAMTGHSAFAVDPIRVTLDQAKVMKIPQTTTTVVVGNPLIADISVQTGGMIVITGKGYGVTNLIAMDARGNTLLEQIIEVEGPTSHVVVLYRGVERESYSCMPNCDRRITLGDNPTYFDATLLQSGRRDSQAQGAAGVDAPRSGGR